MELIRGAHNLNAEHRGCVATIGNFDGVHRGHQAIFSALNKAAVRHQLPRLVILFEPQPQEVFCPDKPIARLTNLREKLELLQNCNIDRVLCLRFNTHFATRSADNFIQELLCKKLGIRHLIVGDDFRFGNNREGTLQTLQTAAQTKGFDVQCIDELPSNSGERISSTQVRHALQAGDFQKTQDYLGHPYCMSGRVAHGDKRGRTIGWPTANIPLRRRVTPLHGVYIVKMHGINEAPLCGVANVGNRPTVDGKKYLLEVHLFDFNKDIYDHYVKVEFIKKVRDEKRFENLDELKRQIAADADVAKNYFNLNKSTFNETERSEA